jgi:hypothetical protein
MSDTNKAADQANIVDNTATNPLPPVTEAAPTKATQPKVVRRPKAKDNGAKVESNGSTGTDVAQATKGNGEATSDDDASLHSTIEPTRVVPAPGGNGETADLMSETVAPEDNAASPLKDLMAEALGSPEEYSSTTEHPTQIPIRKPGLDQWFRVHPDFHPTFYIYQPQVQQRRDKVFLVTKDFRPCFGAAAKQVTLRMCVTSEGAPFMWLCPHNSDGPGEAWMKSRNEVAAVATNKWITIKAADGSYSIGYPNKPEVFGEPKWPPGSFNDWVHQAFPGDLVVDKLDHRAVRYHRGEQATL